MLQVYINWLRMTRAPLMREARWYFLIGIALGIVRLFLSETSDGRELLLRGFIVLTIIAAGLVMYLVLSNTKFRNE